MRQLSLTITILNYLILYHSSKLSKPQIIKLFCLTVRFGGFNLHVLNNYSLKDCDWAIIGIERQFVLENDPLLFSNIYLPKSEFEELSFLVFYVFIIVLTYQIISNIKCLVELSNYDNFKLGLSKLVTYYLSTIDSKY